MITATRCRRLEVWSALQCAGGRRLAIWPLVIAAATSGLLGLNSTLTAQVPLDAEASTALTQWTVVRVWENDTRWDEWVVTDVTRDDTSAVVTFTAGWPHLLLGKAGLVEERTADGRVRLQLDRVGQTLPTLIDELVIAPLEALGVSWVSRGDVTSTAVRDLTLSASTPLQALELIAAPDQELAFRRVGIGGYAIDVLARVGVDGPVFDLRAARNLLTFRQDEVLSEHATVITAQGAVLDGEAGTIAEAVWQVTAVNGNRVTLADVNGGTGPIGYDAQLDSFQLERPNGTTVPIIESTFATQQVECGMTPALTIGDLVRVVDAAADDLLALPCPPAVRDYGRIAGTIERADLPGHRNLIPNSVLRAWAGAGTTPPDGWATTGTVTLSRLTTGPQIRRGVSALQVVTGGAGAGVATPAASVVTTAERPYLSGYLTLWVTAGQVRVELVATTASGTKVYPLGGALATNSELNVPTDLGLAGIDAFAAGITSAFLRVVQHSAAAATVIIESAQLTRSVSQLPFVEGSGGNLLWQAINQALQTNAIPRLRSTVSFLDLARLDPVTFGEDCTVTLGGTARVVLPKRNIDGLARIVQVDRNLLVPGDTAIVLSDKPEDLSGSLARVTWRPRPIPNAPIVVLAGDLNASTAFDAAGALTILVVGPEGADSVRAAVSTSGIPSLSTVDAATGTLRVDGVDVAALTSAGPYAAGVIVYIAVRAYRGGVGTRLLQLTDAADAADAAQGPSLEVRQAETSTTVTITYAAIGTVTYRVNDVVTTLPSSPIAITRPAALSLPVVVTLFCTRNGLVASETVTVYPIGVDTVTPDLVVLPVSSGQLRDTVAFTISATDPSGRGLTLTRRMTLTGCSAIGFTGAGPHTLTNGQTVQIVKPLAQNAGVVEFDCLATGGGRAAQQRDIPARDLTGVGIEVLSNPEFRSDLPRPYVVYDNGSTGLVVLSYGSVPAQNTSGVLLIINKAAGAGTAPGSGGFAIAMQRNLTAAFVADRYREGALYLITLRASIPSGYSLIYASNDFGTGGTSQWLSSQAGINDYAEYVLRLQIGVGGTFSSIGFFWITNGVDTGAVQWGVARINWRDLSTSERQPVASLTARRIGGDADTDIVQVDITPATSESRVWLAASTDVPESGSLINDRVPNSSTWNMPRRAFRTGSGMGFFRGLTPGFEIAEASIVIPEQGRDTVSLSMTAERVGGTSTTEVVRLFPADPFPQGAGTLTLTLLPSTAAVSPTGPLSLTSGSPTDITITKPAQTSEPAIVGATLSNANRVSAYLPIKIEPVRALVPGRIERLPSVQSGLDWTERFRTYRADGSEATSTSDIAARTTRTTPSGAPAESDPSPTRDTVNNWFTFTITRVAGDSYSGRVINEPTNTARSELVFPIPTVPVTPAADTTPRITQILTTNTATLDSGLSDGVLEIAPVWANLPAGGSVIAVFRQGNNLPETVVISGTPTTLRTPVSKNTSTIGRQRLDGEVHLLDSSGGVVASLGFLSVYFWA
jgi:hypothetical protein